MLSTGLTEKLVNVTGYAIEWMAGGEIRRQRDWQERPEEWRCRHGGRGESATTIDATKIYIIDEKAVTCRELERERRAA